MAKTGMDLNPTTRHTLALAFGAIALDAGYAILAARALDSSVQHKHDGSPLTEADLKADCLIRSRLPAILPNVPIISEETFDARHCSSQPDQFILVDPLDGTREFVSGRDEFTVNIALIDAEQPVASAVFAPALGLLYIAGANAFRADVPPGEQLPPIETMRLLKTSSVPEAGLRAIASRSHLDPATTRWLEQRQVGKLCSAGSSLKFCMIAEGEADVYLRLAPTMEWDTAAGHGILSAAGGAVLALDGSPLRYGKSEIAFRNDAFVAWGRWAARRLPARSRICRRRDLS
jgi:3'(2'), 5'-bisphosphate nucleotidase